MNTDILMGMVRWEAQEKNGVSFNPGREGASRHRGIVRVQPVVSHPDSVTN